MAFRKVVLASAIAFALAGCGADDQAYDYLDKDSNQTTIANITSNAPVKIPAANERDAYEIPLDGIWIFQQTLGDVSRTSGTTPYLYDFINDERLVQLKLTKDGLMGDLVEGDIAFEGEVTRFEQRQNVSRRLFSLGGAYEAYECAEDSYGDCTNKEAKVSDPDVRWWQKTHFTPDFEKVSIDDAQRIFKFYLKDKEETTVTHVEFDPKGGVINIEYEHNLIGRNGQPETVTEFFSLVRLDVIASKGYQPIHYDLPEHHKFGFFKTAYEKLDPNYIENQQGYEGYLVNRFDPRKEKIEYHLSDEFFRKDANGNLVNKVWLDATVKGFEYMNKSLADKFSPNGRLVPELVLINKDATEPSNVKVGDIRTNVIHIIPEASEAGLLGFGPSTSNPLTGEILSAYTIMYPGVAQMGVGTAWDELVELYNKKELATPYDVQPYGLGSSAALNRDERFVDLSKNTIVGQPETVQELQQSISKVQEQFSEVVSEENSVQEADILGKQTELEMMMANNMFPAEFSGVSASMVANKTDITELDFFEEGMFVDSTLPEDALTLKTWDGLNLAQRAKVSLAFSTHQYLTTLVHEVGHNLGLRHNFKGSFDGDNFFTEAQARSLDLKGVSATSSIMDYTPSEIGVHPAFGLYDRAALRFAYQRKVAVHPKVDADAQTKEEILAVKRDESQVQFVDLAKKDAAKRLDMSQPSALASLDLGYDLQSQGLQLKEYGYCTDGRGRNTTETGCLVFDEGTSVEAITDAYIERYDSRSEVVNARRNRVEFNENKRYINKLFSTWNTFGRMNMVVDDYYQAYFTGNYKTPAEACMDVSTAAKQEACDVTRAAYKQAYFYLDILKTPEKQCILDMKQELRQPDGTYKQDWAGNSPWSLANTNWLAGQVAGEAYTSKFHLPTSCFDQDLKEAIESGYRYWTSSSTGKSYRFTHRVIAESKHGDFLNKVTFSNRASEENASYIGYEAEHLGIWMDKLLAIESLFQPSGLRGVDFALIDLPGVREEVKDLIDHWALGKPLPAASAQAIEFGNVNEPYLFVDANGNEVPGISYDPEWKSTEIRATPNRLSWLLNRWYGTNRNGGTATAKAYLQSIYKFDSFRTDTYKPEAFEMGRYISMVIDDLPRATHSIEILGRNYYANESNGLAVQMIEEIKKSDIFVISQYSRSELNSHLAERDNILGNLIGSAAVATTNDAALQNALATDPSVTSLRTGKTGTAKWVSALKSQFEASYPGFLSLGHLWGARDSLIASGDMVWTGQCYALDDLGCMFTNDQNVSGNWYNTAVPPSLAFDGLWKSNNALALVTPAYLMNYDADVASLDAIFRVSGKSITDYLDRSFGNEKLRREAIEEAGLSNLVVLDPDSSTSVNILVF
ncbi:TPA: zinc-dependent metalloprotease [Vibrio vulnificus]|nr:zinc-dependent metalloprotease [Vibrio vulnificus]